MHVFYPEPSKEVMREVANGLRDMWSDRRVEFSSIRHPSLADNVTVDDRIMQLIIR